MKTVREHTLAAGPAEMARQAGSGSGHSTGGPVRRGHAL